MKKFFVILLIGLIAIIGCETSFAITLDDDIWWYIMTDPGYYEYYQTAHCWAAVGVLSPNGTDLDISLYEDPNYSVLLANSRTSEKVDFVVGDYNHNNRPQYDYPLASYYSGSGLYYIEYEDSSETIEAPGILEFTVWPRCDVVEIWDVYLSIGEEFRYTLEIYGSSDMGMAIFKSNNSTYYCGRDDARAISDSPDSVDESFDYTAPSTDWYGLAVWSNDGNNVGYRIIIAGTNIDLDHNNSFPDNFVIHENYPNPFNAQTTIKFGLPIASYVTLEIYDLLGSKIASLVNEQMQPGSYQTVWNADNVSSGIYFYRFQAEEFIKSKKMILLK